MDIENTRFVIEKNAVEFLTKFPLLARTKDEFVSSFEYEKLPVQSFSDSSFAKYSHLNADRFASVVKSYPQWNVFLSDIDWISVFAFATKAVASILEELASQKEAVLSVIEVPPLGMVAIGEILRRLGFSNVAYSYKRPFFVNSANHGFESALFLAFADRTAPSILASSVESIAARQFSLKNPDTRYFVITEEPSLSDTVSGSIEPYFKTQIGYKETIPTYRIDRFPESAYLAEKNVKTVVLFDTDRSAGRDFDEYCEDLKVDGVAKVQKAHRLSGFPQDVSSYEQYLVEKTAEYRRYRGDIVRKSESTARAAGILKGSGISKKRAPSNAPSASSFQDSERKLPIVPYYFGIPLIFILFLIVDNGSWGGVRTSSGSTSSGWHGWHSGSSSSSSWSSSSSSSSSSSIRSFGGGGFSKGGG